MPAIALNLLFCLSLQQQPAIYGKQASDRQVVHFVFTGDYRRLA